MDRRQREVEQLITSEGMRIVSRTHTGTHPKYIVEREDGARKLIVAALSGSDRRGMKNMRTILRAFRDNRQT